jgi:hypothetical protein
MRLYSKNLKNMHFKYKTIKYAKICILHLFILFRIVCLLYQIILYFRLEKKLEKILSDPRTVRNLLFRTGGTV